MRSWSDSILTFSRCLKCALSPFPFHHPHHPLSSSTMPEVFTHKFDTPVFKGTVEIPTGIFIDGKFVDGSEGGFIE